MKDAKYNLAWHGIFCEHDGIKASEEHGVITAKWDVCKCLEEITFLISSPSAYQSAILAVEVET